MLAGRWISFIYSIYFSIFARHWRWHDMQDIYIFGAFIPVGAALSWVLIWLALKLSELNEFQEKIGPTSSLTPVTSQHCLKEFSMGLDQGIFVNNFLCSWDPRVGYRRSEHSGTHGYSLLWPQLRTFSCNTLNKSSVDSRVLHIPCLQKLMGQHANDPQSVQDIQIYKRALDCMHMNTILP